MAQTFRYSDPELGDLLSGRRIKIPYRPTHSWQGEYINSSHQKYATHSLKNLGVAIDHEIPGSLRRADAAKIYELVYFAGGPTLDIGTNRGLSAYIASQALLDGGSPETVYSVDLAPRMVQVARRNLEAKGVTNVLVAEADATLWLQRMLADGTRFNFAFVDHSHCYQPVFDVSCILLNLMQPSSFILFHDFVDARNADPSSEVEVVQGAFAAFDGDERVEYFGGCGACGLFKFLG